MKRAITIGTRSSKLAVIQAKWVLARLQKVIPDLEASLVNIITSGDLDSDTTLDKFAEEGVFVKELERALFDSKIDMAVHSLKDLPTEIPDGLSLAAATARLDSRDVLVSRAGKLAELPSGSKIGTGSLRRAIQLLSYRSDFEIGDSVAASQIIGRINDMPIKAPVSGILRGLIRSGAKVTEGDKLIEVDPVNVKSICYTIRDKMRQIAESVLELIEQRLNQPLGSARQ